MSHAPQIFDLLTIAAIAWALWPSRPWRNNGERSAVVDEGDL